MTRAFSLKALPWNIVFGEGELGRLPTEIEKLELSRAIVLTTPGQRSNGEAVADLLGKSAAGLFSEAAAHVPASVVSDAIEVANKLNADCTVAIGGGSTTGLGKALALKLDLPNIVIPTTYAGSEMTNVWGISENERKVTGRDDRVLPNLVLYDPELTLAVPAGVSAASGMNAIAQAVANIATDNPNPFGEMIAANAIEVLHRSLPKVVERPNDVNARAEALYGACLAGASLGVGTPGLHHRLCHVFGGTFNSPHAETHAVLLPHSVAYNASAVASGTQRLAEIMGVENAALGLHDLAKTLRAPVSLKEIGIRESDLDGAAKIVLEAPPKNPEPISETRLNQLLQNAYHGRAPQ